MALALKLTKAEYDKLPDVLKQEYVADGDAFALDVTGMEDTGALKRAKDRESQRRTEAETRAEQLAAELETLQGDAARKNGDIATLEKQWKAKSDATLAEVQGRLDGATAYIQKSLVDTVAMQIATELSDSPAVILPHIKARLQAEMADGEYKTTVTGADGKASALTPAQLKEEFAQNKDFSAIIRGNRASGGGANSTRQGQRPQNGVQGQQGQQQYQNEQPLSEVDPRALAERIAASKGHTINQ